MKIKGVGEEIITVYEIYKDPPISSKGLAPMAGTRMSELDKGDVEGGWG